MSVNIRVLFFGLTASFSGERQIEMELPDRSKASEILDRLLIKYPGFSKHRLLVSVNQQYVSRDEVLCDGDEVGIFTAVSGG